MSRMNQETKRNTRDCFATKLLPTCERRLVGGAWFSELNWCLRLAQNAHDPSDDRTYLGSAPTRQEAVQDKSALIFFPICWEACLVGSRMKFDIEADVFRPDDLAKLREMYLRLASRFVYSPSQFAV